jgi:homospermidine synthase
MGKVDLDFERQWASFDGRLLMLGFGSIGRGLLPLLLRHIAIAPERITIMSPESAWGAMAAAQGVAYEVDALTPDNYRQRLAARLGPGDFLLNLSVDVSSRDLIAWCQAQGVLYLDACVGPWAGGHFDASVTPARRSNYALRASALGLRDGANPGPTAILSHGVNPGLVSHFVKQALLNLAADLLPGHAEPRERRDWAECARRLGVRAIHIAERDTQTSRAPNSPASSSIPGRSRVSLARPASPLNWAGAVMSATGRRAGGVMILAAGPPSGWSARAPVPGCGVGHPWRVHITAS